jgi:type II secretory pathway component PulF
LGPATGGLLRFLPGMSKSLFLERCARFAATLAELLDDGAPLAESLRIAGDGCGDAGLRASAARLADSATTGQLTEEGSPAAMKFPPFLRWAIWHAEETTGRVRALQIAARMYRETAQRRAERFRTVAPVAALVLVGGTVTLLYGLALFVPLVELIYGLSRA